MVWYSHLLKNFPQPVVIYTVKGFGVVNKAEIDVSGELSCFFDVPLDNRSVKQMGKINDNCHLAGEDHPEMLALTCS